MDGRDQEASALAGASEWVLELRGHYRLCDKPARTLEALRIFLRGEADAAFEALRAGRVVVVRRGGRAEVEALGAGMEAQGFGVRVREGGCRA